MQLILTATTPPNPDFVRTLQTFGSVQLCLRDQPLTASDLATLADAEVLLAHPRYFGRLDQTWLQRMPQLKFVIAMSTGVDWIDLPALAARQIQLQTARGASAPSVAEFSWLMALTLTKKILPQLGKCSPLRPTPVAFELQGKTAGIVGYGQIGQHIAQIARGLGMKVCYTDYRQRTFAGGQLTTLPQLCRQSQLIFLALPLTSTTQEIISQPLLVEMSPQSFLINPARGELVNLPAVVTALETGKLAGYAVDTAQLPHPRAAALIAQGLILHTPHIAYQSAETRQRIQAATLAALGHYQSGTGHRGRHRRP